MPDSGNSVVNPERGLELNGPLGNSVVNPEGVAPTRNWSENPGSGGENEFVYNGKVMSVKWGEITKRIGIDGSSKAIKEAIRTAFGLLMKRTFWLEDDNGVIQSFKEKSLRNYNLHLGKELEVRKKKGTDVKSKMGSLQHKDYWWWWLTNYPSLRSGQEG